MGFRVDITNIKQSENLAKEALREKEILLKEIHHRVKNNLQVISSLLSLHADKTNNSIVLESFAEADSRVRSMALVHEILYQTDSLNKIELQIYLEKLTEHLLTVFISHVGQVNIIVDANDVNIGINEAVSCGLIVTELLTNAIKYAYPDDMGGDVKISSVYNNQQGIKMIVADNGCGLPPDFDPKQAGSLGLRLVTELIEEQLEGTWSLNTEDGVCWVIDWPIL